MQSMFRLPWSSEPPGEKIMENAPFHKPPRQRPAVDLFSLNKLKRKRTDSPEASLPHSPHVKKWKCAPGEVKPVVADLPHVVDGFAPAVPEVISTADASASMTTAIATTAASSSSSSSSSTTTTAATASVSPMTQPATLPDQAATTGNNASTQKTTTTTTTTIPLGHANAPIAGESAQDTTGPAPSSPQADVNSLSPLQQAIECQFNYEILLKHNELRLIEQELAKCQVSLEQLRRCQLIPYPGTEGLSENVSLGAGPALKPTAGYTRPSHAAPWGITDGPYTRHYAKWLIPDPKFDSVSEQSLQAHNTYGEGRTRGSFYDLSSGSKPRSSRTSTGGLKFQALGENPAPAPKIDPLIHKRSTDGQWVKLFCASCGHSNFSNTQGFLNHCRIKHNQVYKSHDAAAIACGIPVNMDEIPSASAPSETPTTPAVSSNGAPILPTLIRTNAAKPAPKLPARMLTPITPSTTAPSTPTVQSQLAQQPLGSFIPSPQTPYMSALLAKRGFSGNLGQMVDSARTKIDLDSIEPQSPDEDDAQTPSSAFGAKGKGAKMGGAADALAHIRSGAMTTPHVHNVGGKKGSSARPSVTLTSQPQPQPRGPPPTLNSLPQPRLSKHHSSSSASSDISQRRTLPQSPIEPDLSPHTVESNPGLVSDHDDGDDEDFDEEMPVASVATSGQLLSREGRGAVGSCRDNEFEMRDLVVEDGSDVLEVDRRGRGRADDNMPMHHQTRHHQHPKNVSR